MQMLAGDPYGDAVLAESAEYENQGLDAFGFWDKPDMTASILQTLRNTTIANSDGEYTNLKFSVRPGWVSVPAGFGKTSVALGLKYVYHVDYMREEFDYDTLFYTLKDKFDYLRVHQGEVLQRKFFLTDEPTKLQGLDSMAIAGDAGNLDQSVRMDGLNDAYVETDAKQYGLPINYILRVKARDLDNGVNVCSVHTPNGMEVGKAAFEIPPREVWKRYQKFKRDHITHVKARAFRNYKQESLEALEKLDAEEGIRARFGDWITGKSVGLIKASPVSTTSIARMLAIHMPDKVGDLREAFAEKIFELLKQEYREKGCGKGGETDRV